MDHDKTLLTLTQVRDWQTRRVEIANSLKMLNDEDDGLARKIEAAKVFMDFLPEEETLVAEVEMASSADSPAMEVAEESISHGVLVAVSAMGGSPKPSVIRRWIGANNPEVAAKLNASPAYLYTTLMRHVRAGRLAKRGKGYRLPASSPKGETGRPVTAPGSLNGSTSFDARTVPTAAEAGGI